jgi:hypothetical protein
MACAVEQPAERNVPLDGARKPVKISGRMEGSTTASCSTLLVAAMPAMSSHFTEGEVTSTSFMTALKQDEYSAGHSNISDTLSRPEYSDEAVYTHQNVPQLNKVHT